MAPVEGYERTGCGEMIKKKVVVHKMRRKTGKSRTMGKAYMIIAADPVISILKDTKDNRKKRISRFKYGNKIQTEKNKWTSES